MALPSHVYVWGTWEMRQPGEITIRNFEDGPKWYDIPKQGLRHEQINHVMVSGRSASVSVGQVYSTFEKCVSSLETDISQFKYNGNTDFDKFDHCVVGQINHLWFIVQKVWLDPKDHMTPPSSPSASNPARKRQRFGEGSPVTVSKAEMDAALALGAIVT